VAEAIEHGYIGFILIYG